MVVPGQFNDHMIELQDINLATDNFDQKNWIGKGGFGDVYKGEISHFKGRGLVAFKRLNRKYEQGDPEFLKEIRMLSQYKHENLISLIGFCDEGDEKILAYEYASNRSLDYHLNSATSLTWRQRLKVCLQAARALEYLHDPRGTNQRVIHCDIKSSNILLDDKWNAKISDLGLSKMGPANQKQTFIISSAVGTLGYCDPEYIDYGFLTKESDVYSFGVLLFEVLCGKLCYEIYNDQILILVPTWKKSYEKNNLEEIVFQDLIKQDMDHVSLKIFSDIAYRCLKRSRKQRPTMTEIVTELEIALASQGSSDGKKDPIDYEAMVRTVKPPLKYRCKAEIKILLSRGLFLNDGKTWFSINKRGEHCEMISIAVCLQTKPRRDQWTSRGDSKFAGGKYKTPNGNFEAYVRSQFLTPSITYTVNLVFQYDNRMRFSTIENTRLEYKLKGETEYSIAYLPIEREDGRWMLELYQFDSPPDQSMVNLEILFGNWNHEYKVMEVEGIEFLPSEIVEHNVSKNGNDFGSEDGILPADYEDIMQRSNNNSLQQTTQKELYSKFRNGFLIDGDKEWFSLDKNGLKCRMLPPSPSLNTDFSMYRKISNARFKKAIYYLAGTKQISIKYEIQSQTISPETEYACYLVYKAGSQTIEATLEGKDMNLPSSIHYSWYVHLAIPPIPIFKPKAGQETIHKPLNRRQTKGLPQQRSDGWMEAKIWQFETHNVDEVISMFLSFNSSHEIFKLMVLGIELRPMHSDSSL